MRHRRIASLVAGVLTAGLAVVATAGPASAAPAPINLAGYTQVLSGPSATTNTLLRVPTIGTCPATASFQATVAGSDVQTTAGNSGGGAALICANGVTAYLPQTQINGQSSLGSNPISGGDLMHVQVTISPTVTTVTLNDVTKGWTLTDSGGGATPTAATVGMIAGNCSGGVCSAIPAFSGAQFLASINGRSLAGATRSNLLAANGAAQATAGTAFLHLLFGVTYNFSCTPDPATNRC